MEDLKHSTYEVRAKGSKALRNALQYGDVRAIAVHFNQPYTRVHGILSGKHHGDKDIVECAERIVAYYARIELKESVEEIIRSYEVAD